MPEPDHLQSVPIDGVRNPWKRDGSGAWVIELELANSRQFYNSMDPSPFRERDIDPQAAAFIIGEVEELPRRDALRLVVRVLEDRDGRLVHVPEAVHNYFLQLVHATRRELRRTMHNARIGLLIGLVFVISIIALSRVVEGMLPSGTIASTMAESMTIVAWVALWRPIEMLLYDWWPIRAKIRMYKRLTAMDVSVVMADQGGESQSYVAR